MGLYLTVNLEQLRKLGIENDAGMSQLLFYILARIEPVERLVDIGYRHVKVGANEFLAPKRHIANVCNMSMTGAQRRIERLVLAGVIKKCTGPKSGPKSGPVDIAKYKFTDQYVIGISKDEVVRLPVRRAVRGVVRRAVHKRSAYRSEERSAYRYW